MALIVEDGTGKADAEAYIALADADAYFAARGFTLWATMSENEREQALRRATDYMEGVYRLRWKGYRFTAAQRLSWPRGEVEREGAGFAAAFYETDEVPLEVQNACAELAYRGASGPLADDVGRTTRREKLGPMEAEYSDSAAPFTTYRAVDNMLAPLLMAGGAGLFRKVVRA